ncbi:DNA methyltransferase [Cuniculiplasma sp. SKW3]|uniref:DNA methyltransferase n=1 Tax=Cuniculiplasma sp. SKW3 TaxID=3400170 RepID=UPI003FD60AB6
MEKNEQLFYDRLKDIFIGTKVEGNSGFVNLMKIKSSYFDVVFKELKKEIDEKTMGLQDFREEMYDKLNTFFSSYFSESGSVYFTYTPLKSKIYDKIYTDRDDVILFWKTRMLYYVKTDKLWNNLTVEYEKDAIKYIIKFDVSKLEHKSGNEKREIIYELNNIENNEIIFYVYYSEKGRKTDFNDITKKLKENKIYLDEEDIEKIFKIFERQNEVDYFINKDAKSFLREQFDLWLKIYIFDDESDFSEKRLKELKLLKEIAYKVIDFVSQFEDELVEIWNKPKFVLNSNYVITLDRIANKKGLIEVIEKIIDSLIKQNKEFRENITKWREIKQVNPIDQNSEEESKEKYTDEENNRSKGKGYRYRFEKAGEIDNQIVEWYLLDLIDEDFYPNSILQKRLTKTINEKYKFLPIDTKYFKDIELDILSLFDDLDNELDGWLIHSENYQALNTILQKFKEKAQTIYIDPPFNLGTNADFLYNVNYKDSTWTTMLENRISLARNILRDTGSIFVRCDYNGNWIVRPLMNEIFGKDNFRNEITIAKSKEFFKTMTRIKKFSEESESLFFFSKTINSTFNLLYVKKESPSKYEPFLPVKDKTYQDSRIINDKEYTSPKGRKWGIQQEDIVDLLKEKRLIYEDGKWYLITYKEPLKDVWIDFQGYSRQWGFKTENSEIFIKRAIQSTSNEGDLILDFFLGSGTTTAVAHKLKRKWIGVEMGSHFYTVVLPRMKRVLFYDKSSISSDDDVKSKYNENNAGGFFKYYDLEQYEQTLRKCHYIPSEPFFDLDDKSIYEQYVFLKDPKLLDAMELDYKNNKIKINFDHIYPNIDIAETLSLIRGKKIKKIENNAVTLTDDSGSEEKIYFDNIDFKTMRPLIWW